MVMEEMVVMMLENFGFNAKRLLLLWWNIFNCNCDIPACFQSKICANISNVSDQTIYPVSFSSVCSFSLFSIRNRFHIVWPFYIHKHATLCTQSALLCSAVHLQWMWISNLECVPLCKTTIHKFICGAVLPKFSIILIPILFLWLCLARTIHLFALISKIMHLMYTICTRTSDTYNYNSGTINNIGDSRRDIPYVNNLPHIYIDKYLHTHSTEYMYGSVLLCFHQQLFNEMQIKIIINLNSTIVLGMKLAIIFIIKLRSTLQNAWKTIVCWKIIIFNLVGFLLFYFIIFYE